MDIKKFKRDLNKKPHCIELFNKEVNKKASICAIFPEWIYELCPIEAQMIKNGVYLIVSGGMRVIADDYRVEW